MFSILVSEKGGDSKRLEFDKPEVTIGRVQGNDIILPKGNVSKRHSRIVLKDGKFIIVDLKSTNGTYVNGRKITSPLVVKDTDKIYIGDFILSIDEAGAGAAVEETAAPPPPPRARTVSGPSVAPPRRPEPVEEEQGGAGDGDETFGAQAAEEAPAEPPPPRRPMAAPIPTMRPTPSPAAPPAAPARPPEAPRERPPSRQDIPAIAPSRPTAPPRPVAPPPAAFAPPPSSPAVAPRPRPIPSVAPTPAPVAPPVMTPRRPAAAPSGSEGPEAARRTRILDALRSLSNRLVTSLGNELHPHGGEALRERAEALASELVAEIAQETGLPPGIEPDQLLRDAVSEAVGLGPLDELVLDESVFAITIARPDRIFVDRVGQGRSLTPRWISSTEAAHRILDRVAARAGRVADLAEARARGGLFEARLDNGFVLSATVGAFAGGGVSVVVRRGRRDGGRLPDLAQTGMLSPGMADFLDLAVRSRRNIIVAGVGGSGRSTLIGALARATEGQRVVIVEEAGELDGGDLPWISVSGAGQDARRAFGAALRLKPERLIVGDVRGAEALDVLAAMAGGLDGMIVGITAASSRDALARVVASARLAPEAPSAQVLEAELAAGAHLVVVLGRSSEGEPRVLEISEVAGGAEGFSVSPVFSLRNDGASSRFVASGHVPAWADGAPASMFRV